MTVPSNPNMRNHVLSRSLPAEVIAMREARQRFGLEGVEIARRLKISKTMVSNVLTGTVRGGVSYEAVREFLLPRGAKAESTPSAP